MLKILRNTLNNFSLLAKPGLDLPCNGKTKDAPSLKYGLQECIFKNTVFEIRIFKEANVKKRRLATFSKVVN